MLANGYGGSRVSCENGLDEVLHVSSGPAEAVAAAPQSIKALPEGSLEVAVVFMAKGSSFMSKP